MKQLRQSKDFKISLIFTVIGGIASMISAVYQLELLTAAVKQQVIAQLGSAEALFLMAALQGAAITFIATFIGLKLARQVNLKLNFKYDQNALVWAVLIGLATALIITLSDRFLFAPYLPPVLTAYKISPIYLLTGILYGGVIEEILLRLFVMSLLVLVLWKAFARSHDRLAIPDWIYITAIILAAVLFAAGHLPITFQAIGTSAPIIIRALVLNSVGGLGYGYLYWQKGLAYAMVAHAATHVFMQLILMPLLF